MDFGWIQFDRVSGSESSHSWGIRDRRLIQSALSLWVFGFKREKNKSWSNPSSDQMDQSDRFIFLLGQASRECYSEWIGGDSYSSLLLVRKSKLRDYGYVGVQYLESDQHYQKQDY